MRKLYLAASLCLASSLYVAATPAAYSQNTNSGDIAGVVTDPTGAALPGAKVTVTSASTGSVATAVTDSAGNFHFSLLKPGPYKIAITATGFDNTSSTVAVSQGSIAEANARLTVGSSSTTVEVTDAQPLLQTDDAQITTTLTQEQIQALPNPGGDITYYAQTAPGVVMNTAGGLGNFSVFGLPGTSNNFTVNGEQENDPFLNLNNSGPTNLLLGQNDISSVSVITNAYGAEFGSFGGAQINETSRSGTNKFHGDASYYWNGRYLNANDYFNKQNGNPRFFSNDNQWSAAVGGPIVKDKLFFFVNTEGIRFITAHPSQNFVPNALYQSCVLGTAPAATCAAIVTGTTPTGDTLGVSSLASAGNANEIPFYKSLFAIYNAAPGLNAGGTYKGTPYSTIADTFTNDPKVFAKESLVTGRLDYLLGPKDSLFAHYKYDNGTQPSYVDPISPQFNDVSYQPEDEGQLVETHIFSPKLTNQFLATGAHYKAYFQSVNQAATTALLPEDIIFNDGAFSYLGGIGYVFPQGRNATQYQFADDLSYNRGKHEIKVGYAWKKDDITDFDVQSEAVTPLVIAYATSSEPSAGLPSFDQGYQLVYQQNFPTNASFPVGVYSEGFYVQDTYKPTKDLNLTAGIRLEHNSNPTCPHSCFSRLNTSFATLAANQASGTTSPGAIPYNSIFAINQKQAFPSFEKISYEPRVEIIYSLGPKTVVRGGFGMFSDVFPGQVADDLLKNIPNDPQFTVIEGLAAPSVPGSGAQLAASSNLAFTTGPHSFANGGTYDELATTTAGFSAPNVNTVQSHISYPTYEEYSLQVQRELNRNTSFEIAYAGNHGYHEAVVAGDANAFGAFTGIPTSAPAAQLGTVTDLSSTASSNYNGVLVSIIHRSKLLTAQLNYTRSHALDQISNGGFNAFNSQSSITSPIAPDDLQYNYGNADEDVRNSLNGNYLINVPSLPFGGGLVKSLTGGLQIAGTVFYRSGFPFTVIDSGVAGTLGNFDNAGGGLNAIPAAIVGHPSKTCNGHADAFPSTCLNLSDFAAPTAFQYGLRNAFQGPHYFNTDLTVNKAFTLPYEGVKMIVGVNAYNILNHPNFTNPVSDINSAAFGFTSSAVSVPTSIYGSGLGGDSSIRILQLHAKVSF